MKFFSSLRFQVAFTFLIVVIVTTLSLGSLLIKETETKFWKAEEEKLSTIGRQLVSSYNRVSEKLKVQADLLNTDLDVIKKTQLETALFDYTKPIHEENEEIGVGFFIYGDDFNRPLAVQESKSKDSEKIRVVFPVYENGKKAGFVWVEEPKDLVLSEIESLKAKERNIILVVLLISGILAIYISLMFVKKVTIIKTGLENLKSDLSYKLPVMNGEIGEISRAINDLSTSLLVSRSNSEKILETIASGVLIVSRDGIVKEFNRACEELLGVRKKDVIGKRYTLFPHLKEIVETVKGGGKFREKKIKIGGNEKIFHIFSTPFNGDDLLISVEDVTEEVKLLEEKRRTEALKTLGMFTTGVAHEIRNPLTSIKGFAQILEKRLEGKGGDEERYIKTILSEVKRLENILKDLLMYGRPSPPNKIMTNISKVIRDSLSLLNEKLKEKNIKVEIDFEYDPRFSFDPKQMEQVFINLILNAIDASEFNSKIVIRTKKAQSGILIEVKDFGFGIKEEDREKIFMPFFTTKEKGTGLGLPISQKIVEMHDGRIWFNSNEDGTTFFVYIPIK